MKKSELRSIIREEIQKVLKENTLSNSEKSAAIEKIGNAYPKLLSGDHQSADIAKNFKRSKDNKFTVKGNQYSKDDFLNWTKEPWAENMFDKDDIDAIIYYFDKWPKKGSEIKLKGEGISHFVDVTPSAEKFIKQKWPNGKSVDYNGLFIYEWQDGNVTKAIAHSLDDTWFLMTKIKDESFKIDDILYVSV